VTRPTFAAIAFHYPRPEHRSEWIEVMNQVRARMDVPGRIDVIGYADLESGRLVAISRWESREALEAVIGAAIEQATALDRKWADTPTEVFLLEELT
jgi:quinol monooxygenase YgiN